MKDQLNGFYEPPTRALARNTDPKTSKRAAAGVKVNPLEAEVLKVLAEYGPMNNREIAAKAMVDLQSITPRMKPLETKGKIERVETDERMTKWRIRVDG